MRPEDFIFGQDMLRSSGLILTCMLFLFSCKQKQGDELSEFLYSKPETVLALDNGKKWKANSATTIGIKNMIAITGDFKGADTADYHYLGLVLFDEYVKIFEQCNMMGEAHAQLHAYLFPLYDKIDSLRTCTDCPKYYDDLVPYLKSFGEYFE